MWQSQMKGFPDKSIFLSWSLFSKTASIIDNVFGGKVFILLKRRSRCCREVRQSYIKWITKKVSIQFNLIFTKLKSMSLSWLSPKYSCFNPGNEQNKSLVIFLSGWKLAFRHKTAFWYYDLTNQISFCSKCRLYNLFIWEVMKICFKSSKYHFESISSVKALVRWSSSRL